jgi:hypothetical protein
MSSSICRRCFSLFKDGERISFVGSANYKILKSSIHYALDRASMEIDPETLVHASQEDCTFEDEYQV